MIMQVSWLPDHPIVSVREGACAAVKPVLCCIGFSAPVCPVSRLRPDASPYGFPPPDKPGKLGPEPEKGNKQPSLSDRTAPALSGMFSIVVPAALDLRIVKKQNPDNSDLCMVQKNGRSFLRCYCVSAEAYPACRELYKLIT